MNLPSSSIYAAQGLEKYKGLNPLALPSTYFEESAQSFLAAALAADSNADQLLHEPCRKLPFACPDGYFDSSHLSFMQAVASSDRIINEMDGEWHTGLPFDVPDGYFDQLSAAISARIHDMDEDLVDDQYLRHLDRNMPYRIPDGYFENTSFGSNAIEQPATLPHPAAVAAIKPIARRFRYNSLAAVATVALIFGLGSFWMLGGGSEQPSIYQQLAMIPKSQISNYIKGNIEDFDLNLLEASASKSINTPHSENLLKSVDKADIEAYLQSEGI